MYLGKAVWIDNVKDPDPDYPGQRRDVSMLVMNNRVLAHISSCPATDELNFYYPRMGVAVGPPRAHGMGRVNFGCYVDLDTAKAVVVKYFTEDMVGLDSVEEEVD